MKTTLQATQPKSDIEALHLAKLSMGTACSRTLSDAIAVNQTILLRHVFPDADEDLILECNKAQELGILKRMKRIGAILEARLSALEIERLAAHHSDTVRGWVCFLLAERTAPNSIELIRHLKRFANDEHFAVREWAWMAARPTLVNDLTASIKQLADLTSSPSDRVRRFASEALRPRGVWASHIAMLKQHPELGEPIIYPLRKDTSRYVQDSVANWINDASKTRPDWAIQLCTEWLQETENTATTRIVKRALRSIT